MLTLYGTVTSPFVRRVRIVAAEIGLPVQRIDTASDEGMAQLRALTPIRKVPIAQLDGRTLFDSRVIIDWLVMTRGWGALSPPQDPWQANNVLHAIDAAIESAISLFYLRRDGVAIDGTVYATRQLERIDAIFAWLATQLAPSARHFAHTGQAGSHEPGFGLAEISLLAALDWMDFRHAYPTERAGRCLLVRQQWSMRHSVVSTGPAS